MDLVTALAKMTLLPARRMEKFAPAFNNKGRLREGFDADLTLFDPGKVTDMATFQQPQNPSNGIRYVVVNGEFVLREGKLIEAALPGKIIKAAGQKTPLN
jgi:dihydroorotase